MSIGFPYIAVLADMQRNSIKPVLAELLSWLSITKSNWRIGMGTCQIPYANESFSVCKTSD